MEGNSFNQELEDIIRTVLGNLDNLQPFSSTHFNVFPYKKRWEGLSKVMCKHEEKNLSAYPFILILYLEKNTPNGTHAEKRLSPEKEREHRFSVSKPQSKRTKTDSPLEEAILLDLVKELEAESRISMVGRLHVDNPHEEGEVKEDPGHVVKPNLPFLLVLQRRLRDRKVKVVLVMECHQGLGGGTKLIVWFSFSLVKLVLISS
ncbi:uncharacterized protein LOC133949878 isoform X1 [Platichthys flesus]|uniref:uncharacterized protein LOC133949878 isoform X1 n=1 Tax=Platichthys flesus TaxID=8260 RepID=UPI002DB60046|nr:uncharacterized protein LOC133949878 isoform X1 [Platichthys flesus]